MSKFVPNVQPPAKVDAPKAPPVAPEYALKAVSFMVPVDVLNRGSLSKISQDMESLAIEMAEDGSGVWVTTGDPRVKTKMFVPIYAISSIRYDASK